MKQLGPDKLRLSILAALSLTATSHAFAGAGGADTTATQTAAPSANSTEPTPASTTAGAPQDLGLDTIVVTGSTSKRTLLDASVDVTSISEAQLKKRREPRPMCWP